MLGQNLSIRKNYYPVIFTAFIHIGAIIILCVTPLPITLKWVGILMVVGSFRYSAMNYLGASAILNISACANQEWMLVDRQGGVIHAELVGDSIVTTRLIILNFKVILGQNVKWWRRHISVILFGDMLEQEEFRRLRVYLRASRMA